MYQSLVELVERAEKEKISLGELAFRVEAEQGPRTREEVVTSLKRALEVMRGAIARGRVGDLKSVSGLVGGDAAKLRSPQGPLKNTVFTDMLAGHSRSRK